MEPSLEQPDHLKHVPTVTTASQPPEPKCPKCEGGLSINFKGGKPYAYCPECGWDGR